MNKSLVSISCITYNHSKFIEECLDGFLMQQTDFGFEVLIHDDASTDGTQDIIRSYQEKYPDIIKPIFQSENQYSKGVRGINAKFNYSRAQGKYIALCEGDDYWTDPLKLQKQVNFLEENLDFSGYGTNSKMLEDSTGETRNFNKNKKENYILTVDDLLGTRHFHTASFIFRSTIDSVYKVYDVLSGDRLLFLLVAFKGKIYYSNDVTCIYRKNQGGLSRSVKSSDMIRDIELLKITEDFLLPKQRYILRKFVYKTILDYSFKIKINHFISASFWILLMCRCNYTSRQIVKKSMKKLIF